MVYNNVIKFNFWRMNKLDLKNYYHKKIKNSIKNINNLAYRKSLWMKNSEDQDRNQVN